MYVAHNKSFGYLAITCVHYSESGSSGGPDTAEELKVSSKLTLVSTEIWSASVLRALLTKRAHTPTFDAVKSLADWIRKLQWKRLYRRVQSNEQILVKVRASLSNANDCWTHNRVEMWPTLCWTILRQPSIAEEKKTSRDRTRTRNEEEKWMPPENIWTRRNTLWTNKLSIKSSMTLMFHIQ